MVRLPKRTREHVLEDESERFARRIVPSEWITERKEHDYGVDLQVEIVRNESVTGARFSIQLKSTDSLKVRKKAYIAHPCATSALFYYLQLPEPVVYLVYDAKVDEGYWIWIQEFLRGTEVDPNWKSKDKVTVRIPKENVFDRRAIKQIVARVLSRHDEARWLQAAQTANNPYYAYTFATNSQGFSIGISPRYPGAELDSPIRYSGTFKFDQSEEGRAALEALDKSIKTGSSVKLDSRFFEGFDFSAVHPDLFAHVDGFRMNTVELLPVTDDHKIMSKLLVLDRSNKVLYELPYIEFRQVQSGTEETTYSNEHQGIPLKLSYVVNKPNRKVHFYLEMVFLNQNVVLIRDFLHFNQAIIKATSLKLVDLLTQQSVQLNISGTNIEGADDITTSLIEDLSFIQEQTNVPLVWPGEITTDEAAAIEKAAKALRIGSYEEQASIVTVTLYKSAAQEVIADNEKSSEIPLVLGFADVVATILGNKISLGPGRVIFPRVSFKEATAKISKRIARLPDDAAVKLQFLAKEPGVVHFLRAQS